jgi:hypothetical protein
LIVVSKRLIEISLLFKIFPCKMLKLTFQWLLICVTHNVN